MKISEAIFALLLTVIMGLTAAIYAQMNSKADMISQRIDEVSQRITNMGERIRAVEVQLNYAPQSYKGKYQ